MEEEIIKKLNKIKINQTNKPILYKMCSKICKINVNFLTKIQQFFPRLYEVIS